MEVAAKEVKALIPVFVVSLPDCVDRRASIQKCLDGLQIPFEFVDAVDGRNGLEPSFEADIDRQGSEREGPIMSDAEFACALSHIQVYRRIVQHDIDWALVLEDDAIPTPNVKTYVENRYYEDADLTQLHFNRTRVSRLGSKHLFGAHSSYLRSKFKSPSAVGYVISNRAARHILENGVPVTQRSDWPKCVEEFISEKRFRVVNPPIVKHPRKQVDDHSIISQFGREDTKNKRRFLGVYIPPVRTMLVSIVKGPIRLNTKQIPGIDWRWHIRQSLYRGK